MFRVSPYENVGKNELDLFESATTRRRKVPYHSQANKRRHIKGVIELMLHLCSRLHKKMIVKSILMRHYNPITYKSAPWHNGSWRPCLNDDALEAERRIKSTFHGPHFQPPKIWSVESVTAKLTRHFMLWVDEKLPPSLSPYHVFESNLCGTKNQVCVFLAQSNTTV